MTGKERVARTIRRQPADRMPVYGWVNNGEFQKKVEAKYGSIAGFHDKYEFDMYHLFPPSGPFKAKRHTYKDTFYDDALPEIEFTDPDDLPYDSVKPDMERNAGRFIYAQAPGCFECMNGVWGIENHLAYLIMHTDQIRELYQKLAQWTVKHVSNLLDLGVDMIHISDDWGSQSGMLFSMDIWHDLVYPYHKAVAKAVKERGAFLSLHCDGNFSAALDGICDIGYDVVHPYQESAGMDYGLYFQKYKDNFLIHGGLDVQTTIGFGDYERLEREIRRVYARFKDHGLLFCTTHMIQPHCTLEEAEFAYDLIYRLVREE
jgi:uroporphyrinogen decarboxylase